MGHPSKRPVLDRSRPAVLQAATRLLLERPELSLGELAARIGISRTTLHRMFPTREAVLAAVAHDAIDHLVVVYTEAGLDPTRGGSTGTHPTGTDRAVGGRAVGDRAVGDQQGDPIAPFRRVAEMLVPLGPQLMFLLRAHELRGDVDIDRRLVELDEPLLRAVEHAQRGGTLDPTLPVWWIVESLYATVFIAWEQVERGRLAARDAAPLVMRTWLGGAMSSGGAVPSEGAASSNDGASPAAGRP